MVSKDNIIYDKYKIIDELSKGYGSIVYKVESIEKKEIVVLKKMLLDSNFLNDLAKKDYSLRFVYDADVIKNLNHQNLVKIFSANKYNLDHYITMEYIKGETLSSYLKRGGSFFIKEAINIIIQILKALEYIHSKKIIHKNIEPDNIYLYNKNKIKISNFSILKAPDHVSISSKGAGLGSIGYMSPEQCNEKGNIDLRSDIFSVSVILYQLLCKKQPYPGKTLISYITKLTSKEFNPVSPRFINSAISIPLEKIIFKGLEKDPNKRYQNTAQMMIDIKEALKDYCEDNLKDEPLPLKNSNLTKTAFKSIKKDTGNVKIKKKKKPKKNLNAPVKLIETQEKVADKIEPQKNKEDDNKINNKFLLKLNMFISSLKDKSNRRYFIKNISLAFAIILVIWGSISITKGIRKFKKVNTKKTNISVPKKEPNTSPIASFVEYKKKTDKIENNEYLSEIIISSKIGLGKVKLFDSEGKICKDFKRENYDDKSVILKINPGIYTVKILKENCYPIIKKNLDIKKDEHFLISDKFVKTPCILVNTNKESTIFLNGKNVGKTKKPKLNLKISGLHHDKEYKITSYKKGFLKQEKIIKIAKDKNIENIKLTLKKVSAPKRRTTQRVFFRPVSRRSYNYRAIRDPNIGE